MRLRKPPTRPNRKHFVSDTKEIKTIRYIDQRLDAFLDDLQDILNDHPNAIIKSDLDYGACYYEGDRPEPILTIEIVRSADEHYAEAMIQYQKRLDKYNQWYSENKEAIEKELEKRKTKNS